MAGSWQHMTTKGGRLRNNKSFCDMIENLGDAYEAAEECYGMILWLANEWSVLTGASRAQVIREAEAHCKDGLRLGGLQGERR